MLAGVEVFGLGGDKEGIEAEEGKEEKDDAGKNAID